MKEEAAIELLGGYEWAYLDCILYDELWTPMKRGEMPTRAMGLQLLGRFSGCEQARCRF